MSAMLWAALGIVAIALVAVVIQKLSDKDKH
jgi:hypothetical protein